MGPSYLTREPCKQFAIADTAVSHLTQQYSCYNPPTFKTVCLTNKSEWKPLEKSSAGLNGPLHTNSVLIKSLTTGANLMFYYGLSCLYLLLAVHQGRHFVLKSGRGI